MADYKKAKGVLPQGGPAPEDLVRAARGDFEPLYREAQAENLRLQAQVAEKDAALEAAHDWLDRFGADAPIVFGGEAELSGQIERALASDGSKLLEVVKAAEHLVEAQKGSIFWTGKTARLGRALASWRGEE